MSLNHLLPSLENCAQLYFPMAPSSNKMDNLFAKLERLFNDELGMVKDIKAHNWLMPSSELQFYKVYVHGSHGTPEKGRTRVGPPGKSKIN